MKNNKGITLIALVITIIVLLILAGVTIAMLSGDNGILTKASKAVEDTDEADKKEEVSRAINELMTEYYDAKYVSNTLTDSAQTSSQYVLANIASKTTATVSGNTITTAKDKKGKQYKITYTGDKLGEWEEVTTNP